MKKLLPLLLATLALAGCRHEKGPDLDREILLSLSIKVPGVGSMVLADDALAIKDEARINLLGIYVFGPDPEVGNPQTTDDYRLESVFLATGEETAELTNGQAIEKSGLMVRGATMKHFFFVANAALSVTGGVTTETRMLQMLAHEQGILPRIDSITPGDPASKLTVVGDGIPMSSFARVDCSVAGIEQTTINTQLERAVARFEVTNATTGYRVLGARVTAYDRGLLFDTTGFGLTLPSGSFSLDYPAGVVTDALDLVHRYIPPMAQPTDKASPEAMGYLWPTSDDDVAVITINYQLVDADGSGPGTAPGGVLSMDVPFTRGGVADTVKRNHVYRVTITDVIDDAQASFETKDWERANSDLRRAHASSDLIKAIPLTNQ